MGKVLEVRGIVFCGRRSFLNSAASKYLRNFNLNSDCIVLTYDRLLDCAKLNISIGFGSQLYAVAPNADA